MTDDVLEAKRLKNIDTKIAYCNRRIDDHVARIKRSANAIGRWQRRIYNLERQREVPLTEQRRIREERKQARKPTTVKRVVREAS